MDETLPRIFGSDGTFRLASAAEGGYLRNDELAHYPDDDDGDDWDFADVLVDSHVDVRAINLQVPDGIRALCRLANVVLHENARNVFSEFVEPRCYHGVRLCRGCESCGAGMRKGAEKTAASLQLCWALESIDMVFEREESLHIDTS